MEAKLVVVSGKAPAGEYSLRLPTIIGRSRSVSIPIGHPLISRQHCELFESAGVLMVRDLGSLNGTYVDDLRLADKPVTLPPGRRLTVGAVTFQAAYQLPANASINDLPDFTDDVAPDAGTKIVEQTVDGDGPAASPAARGDQDDPADLEPPALQRHGEPEKLDLGWLDDPHQSDVVPVDDAGPARGSASTKQPPKPPGKAGKKSAQQKPSSSDDDENLDDFFDNLQ